MAFSTHISDCDEKGNTVAMHVLYVALQIVFARKLGNLILHFAVGKKDCVINLSKQVKKEWKQMNKKFCELEVDIIYYGVVEKAQKTCFDTDHCAFVPVTILHNCGYVLECRDKPTSQFDPCT